MFQAQNSSIARTIVLMVALALAIRIAVIPFLIDGFTDSVRDYWNFGCEEGRIATSMAAGEGFSSPLFGKTGPTAWSAPVYPSLLAAVFLVFGIHTHASAWAILILNGLFSALTCIPIYFMTRRAFGRSPALWAGWVWALFPYAIYFSVGYMWGHSLDALMVALVLWCTLAIEDETNTLRWMAYGVLWGVAALTIPVILSSLPLLWGWLIWRRRRRGMERGGRQAAAFLALLLTVSPWFVRNYRTFGRFVPFRNQFGLVLWDGNTGDTSDLYPDWTNPAHNDSEMEKYRTLGELAFMREKRGEAIAFIRCYPGLFLWLTAKRIIFTWTGFWSLRPDYLAGEPFAFPNIAFCTSISVLLLIGLRRAYQIDPQAVVPFLLLLFSYPLVYYVTHPGMDQRHPLDPVCVVFLGVLGSAFAKSRVREPVLTQLDPESPPG
jgi:4-amino-4-deoxy-L-arabinose transferase-like glycosyltransferase